MVAKRSELIKTKEKFLKAVFNAIQDGISVLDTEMNVIMIDHAMEKWYGNVVGKKCYEAYQNRREPCEDCPTIEAMKSGEMESRVVPGPKGLSFLSIEKVKKLASGMSFLNLLRLRQKEDRGNRPDQSAHRTL